jgi:zinc-finger binding domain of transposase IS66
VKQQRLGGLRRVRVTECRASGRGHLILSLPECVACSKGHRKGPGTFILPPPALRSLGEDSSEALEYIPARFKVIRAVRPNLSRACCSRIVQEPVPHRPADKGLLGVSGMDPRSLYVQYLAHDDRQNFNVLFRLREPRNNCCNLIEYLVPALYLAALLCALHRFISN